MPVKKDENGKRWVEMELILPGTPDQVWQAVATGPGVSAWFTRCHIEERVGGTVQFDFGPNGTSTGEVTAWQPPFRFGYVEREWSEGAPPCVTEITVTRRPDGKSVFCMVHSLATSTDEWDESLESFESGWPGFFEVLRLYLAHFAGSKAASFLVVASANSPQAVVWKRLTEALNLDAANFGDERTTDSPEKLTGTIMRVEQSAQERYILLRLTAPVQGIALIGTFGDDKAANASMTLYLYGDDVEQRSRSSESKWGEWLCETFKQPADQDGRYTP
ncbi:SRPBCC domain-containing protein [Phragmitibacter flavus]|uniref:SRPBCC domain-containing protein n=1 Tax=Phragmitibacter flavus TaxID=2576071 RepID=A0A5R8KGB2_9BACT|nr:SRPBCC domain-containing protein [Phragmitibacter flavus]TLD71343.1 SRPBCC domain-containing protein [Phragmitibacter flavus]